MASSSSSALTSEATEEEITLTVKWSGKEYTVRLCSDDSVGELKRRICQLTNVLPKRQKLLYPKIGNKLVDDSNLLSNLPLKSSLKMTMIGAISRRLECKGEKLHLQLSLDSLENVSMVQVDRKRTTKRPFILNPIVMTLLTSIDVTTFVGIAKYLLRITLGHILLLCIFFIEGWQEQTALVYFLTCEDDIIVDQVESPEIVDDFEIGQDEVVDIKDKDANKQKLRRRIELKNPCRKGKKLLVLDIDYTLFDHRSTAENPLQLMRPYLHEFLTAAYAEYDIIIWSATSMKWVELKMSQLGVLSNPNYKITALLDHLAMITVQSDSRGIFDCKPLGLIWALFPEYYSAKNTIMFDDLRRNFVMNPQNGLTIKPFRKAHENRDSDRELVKLTQYLLAIADLDDISILDHKKWESYDEANVKRRRHT
ncbi:ubiquitin-like domain-containing CTD phosphatase [Tanacetum coccineum]